VTSSGGPPALIEVAARGVSKASGIATLTNALGISSGAVMACGDMPNDLPMLAWAGRSVAPSSAHPAVLAVVDVITTDCDSDGIAIAIEDLLRRECLVPDPSCGEHNVTRQDSV
jgi:hydroxymethylpyrimidine pyrophosphatase-like HAD family hydrolase